jgi:DNA-directed RNA polymerase specialized sigma24 family protein
MNPAEQKAHVAADLQWLATLLTGSRDTAADVTEQWIASAGEENGFFYSWMSAWSRRLLIARALTAVSEDLARSARQTASRSEKIPALPKRPWTLDRDTGKPDLERALLAIDLFPRAAVLLLLFEGVPLADAAVLLDAEPDLVRKGQAAGVVELTRVLAGVQGRQTADTESSQSRGEFQHA